MNMKVYCIVDWDTRYEVSEKGTEYRPGDRKKANLKYVRLAVHGKSEGVGWKRLRRAVGDANTLAAFGLFSKLLELAADQEREFRGFLLDEQKHPASAEYMEMLWGIPQDIISQYLPKLVEIGWIAETDFRNHSGDFGTIPNDSENFGKIPESSEITPQGENLIPKTSEFTPPNETETEHNITITKTETVSENFGKEKIQEASASDSGKEVKSKSAFVLKVADVLVFRPNSSDHTAILNLADYLDTLRNKKPRVFDEVIEVARSKISSTTIRNPIAAFFADVKKRYGFN